MEEIEDAFEVSSKIIGIKPITEKMIDEETKCVTAINQKEPTKMSKKQLIATATKNLVAKFFRENLKMDNDIRDEIDILEIFPSRTEESNIMYIRCETTDDINEITSRVRNLGNDKGTNAPSIVNHIPKIMYKRYHHCEKMLWKLRMSNPGKYQTKIRSGTRDFILKCKVKGDDTPWSQVPSMSIPEEAPGAEIHLLKENIKETNKPNTNPAPTAPPGPPNSWNEIMNTQYAIENIANSTPMEDNMCNSSPMDMQGTISANLKWTHFLKNSKLSIYNQLNSRVNALKILKKPTPFPIMKKLADGIFSSKLHYGAETWVSAPKFLIKKIQHLQLEAARTCLGPQSYYCSTTTLLKKMKWLPVENICKLAAAKLIHRIIQTKKPALLSQRFTDSAISNRATRLTGNLKLGARPRSVGRTTTTRQHFRAAVYSIYEEIPDVLKQIPKSKFKKKT